MHKLRGFFFFFFVVTSWYFATECRVFSISYLFEEGMKSSGKEENEFNVIVSELKKLENDFSTDVAVLREQIELASLDFTEAQKRFDKLERDYIAAKLELFVKKERKEQLTTHLCSFIKKNEIEKAKTISGFVGKLELAPCPMEKLINEQGDLCDRQTQDEQDTSKDSAENTAGQ